MRRLLPVVLAAVLVSGCGGLSASGRLKDKTAVLIDAANAHNVADVTKAAEDLRAEILAQNQGGKITDNKAKVLLQFLGAIERDAPLLADSPSPSATPSVTPSATGSPTASPTPSPTPSPTASPTPSPAPVLTTAPPTLPPPTVGVGIGGGQPSPTAAL